MAFTTLGTMAQDDAITVDSLNQIKTNEDDLNSRVTTMASIDVPNGGFEVDTDSDGIPDNWSEVSAPSGGSKGIETSAPIQGAQSFYQSRTSGASNHGGVYASDYIPCDEQHVLTIQWLMRASAAGITCKVDLYWYKKDQTACTTASTNAYNSASNPTSNTIKAKTTTPPTDARFFKIRISLTNDTNVAGTVYWDRFTAKTTTVNTVVGYADSSAARPYDRVHINGVLSSPVCTVPASTRYGPTIAGAKAGIVGGGNVVVDLRTSGATGLQVTIALPDGLWTVFAIGSHEWDGTETYWNSLAAVAIREA